MKKCPRCGYEQAKSENKPWIDSEFNKENFTILKLLLERTIQYERLRAVVGSLLTYCGWSAPFFI
jgi:hypothetical protein